MHMYPSTNYTLKTNYSYFLMIHNLNLALVIIWLIAN